jgi:hypothetical protein
MFSRENHTEAWSQIAVLKPQQSWARNFGASVGIDSSFVAVASPLSTVSGFSSGMLLKRF